jgi:hypothetical protein
MTKKFNVIRTGGSIGEISQAMKSSSWDAKNRGVIVKTFDNKEEAHDFAKAMRSWLTPGERSYYKMSYKTVEVK